MKNFRIVVVLFAVALAITAFFTLRNLPPLPISSVEFGKLIGQGGDLQVTQKELQEATQPAEKCIKKMRDDAQLYKRMATKVTLITPIFGFIITALRTFFEYEKPSETSVESTKRSQWLVFFSILLLFLFSADFLSGYLGANSDTLNKNAKELEEFTTSSVLKLREGLAHDEAKLLLGEIKDKAKTYCTQGGF